MAHYRHGRKVPALPPVQRHAIGAVTIVIVFALVALTTWRPVVFAVPALIMIAGLGALDQAVVTSRRSYSRMSPGSGTFGPDEDDEPDQTIVDAAVTMVLPRVRTVHPPRRAPRREGVRPQPTRPEDDVLSWSTPENLRMDDPDAAHTMAIDMRAFLDDGPVWVR